MPLLSLKLSPTVETTIPHPIIFSTLHEILVNTIDNGKLSACKSWIEQINNVYVGDGSNPHTALVALTIALFCGRPLEQRKSVTEQALAYLKTVYVDPDVKIMVEVREIERETYLTA
jgi:5-carboxymethyl-2-hydroxymuconate isomerase